MCATAEDVIKQNNAIDIYEEYWAEVDDAAALDTEAASMSTIAQLKDPHAAAGRRGAQNLSWHPDGSHKVCLCKPVSDISHCRYVGHVLMLNSMFFKADPL